MRRRLEERFGDRLSLRIGANTGEVIVGRARAQSSFVTGDAVNVAARLEQGADPGEILVGERAAALVARTFEFGPPLRIVNWHGKSWFSSDASSARLDS
jgi:class 3 adenylate cyclase